MTEQDRIDLTISGVGQAAGGTYQLVNIQGVGTVHGDVDCVDCKVDGVATVHGNVCGKNVRMKGKAYVQGTLTAELIHLEGQVKVNGDCSAEKFMSTGSCKVNGLLNAGDVYLQLFGPCYVSEIGAGTIRVEKERGRSLFRRLKKLSVETIEGDEIYLEHTRAKVVRGNRVVIGDGCEVDLVEYRTHLEHHSNAHVGRQTKI